MEGPGKIKHSRPVPPFLRWCSATIPAVFDDSLTYYEALCSLWKWLQTNLVEVVNNNATVTQEYMTLVDELKDFVDNYFENLDVQNEINNKLDSMAQDGELGEILQVYIQPIVNRQNEQINNLNSRFNEVSSQVNNLVNMNPIPVDSASSMTNTNKIYLLTTTGHWFYYDSDNKEWKDGGVYQSTVVDGINYSNIEYKGITPSVEAQYNSFELNDDFAEQRYWTQNGLTVFSDGTVANAQSNVKSITALLPRNKFITIKRSTTTDRFRVGLCTQRPVSGVKADMILDDATKDFVSVFTGDYSWVIVLYTTTNETADISITVENKNKLENSIGAENLLPFVPVAANTELYNPALKVNGYGTRSASNNYGAFVNDNTYNSYVFALSPNTNYTIEKSGGNAFRVCLWRDIPRARVVDDDNNNNYIQARPSKFIIDDADETECSFDSEDYVYCTILYSTNAGDASFSIKANKETYKLSEQWYQADTSFNNGVYVFNPQINALDEYWSLWNGRLAYGMNTSIAPVPVQINSQLFVNGTIMSHVNPNNTRGFNRWGFHVYEAYAKDNYSRMTMLLNKHDSEFDSKPSLEYYYYIGASHKNSAYGFTKIGSDVNKHSFAFDRDKMIANGVIDCIFPIQVARINTTTDLDDTYTTVEQADTAYEAESHADENIKCLKWIALKNATNGAMFYDTQRQKLVIKIGNQWQDVQTTPVPSGTYNFE